MAHKYACMDVQKGSYHYCWKCKLGQPLWKSKGRLPSKLKTDLPYDPATSFPGSWKHATETLTHQCSLLTIIMEPTNKGMGKETVTHTHTHTCAHTHTHARTHAHTHQWNFSSIEKNEVMSFARKWVQLEMIVSWIKPVSGRQTWYFFICVSWIFT